METKSQKTWLESQENFKSTLFTKIIYLISFLNTHEHIPDENKGKFFVVDLDWIFHSPF